ncbi:MAG: hypothetical protein HXS44_12510 [Theionarchaea archaeon]|nr:hypothetical protein [Theionarchaea archaeon]
MQRKIIIFVCAVLGLVLALSVVTALQNRSEMSIKEEKIISTVEYFIDVFNHVDQPEYKTMYWELLSKQTRDKLIQQAGSLDAAQREVWIMLQGVVDAKRQITLINIEHVEITGNIVTVLVRVIITEEDMDPVETTSLHKYRWENGEWKFIDWNLEPEMYRS